MVGMAVNRKLAEEKPAEMIIASKTEDEARSAVGQMQQEVPDQLFTPVWGNIFVRDRLKDLTRDEILNNPGHRARLIAEVLLTCGNKVIARPLIP